MGDTMIMMNLDQYEMMTLSTFSRINVSKHSFLFDDQLENFININPEAMNLALGHLTRDGLITKENDLEILAKEFEPAFLILHKPDYGISFKRLREVHISDTNFSFNKGFGVYMQTNANSSMYTLTYPYTHTKMENWISNELFAGFEYGEAKLKRYQRELNLDEIIILNIMMALLMERIEYKQDALTTMESVITLDQIKEFNRFDKMAGMIINSIGPEVLERYVDESPAVDESIENLIEKDFLVGMGDMLYLTDMCKDIFDPAKVQDCIQVIENSPNSLNISSVNVMRDGYIVMKPSSDSENRVVEITTYPWDDNILDILKSVTEFSFK